MKTFLRLLFLLCIAINVTSAKAQTGACGVKDLILQNVKPVDGATCTYSFDLAFTLTAQQTKFVFFQTYVSSIFPATTANPYPYPDYFKCENGAPSKNGTQKAPKKADIGTPFINVAIDNNSGAPTFTTYLPDPSVSTVGVVAGSGITSFLLPDGSTRYLLTGLQVSLPASLCGKPLVLSTDFFAAVGNAQNAQCVTCNVKFAAGFFSNITGNVNCAGQYTITLQKNPLDPPFTATYQVYLDANDNQVLTTEGGFDVLLTPTPLAFPPESSGTFTITGTVPASANYNGQGVFLYFTLDNGASAAVYVPAASCAPLPVNFKSFTATRKGQNVAVRWETASEQNNKGFTLQRNMNGTWENVAFISSKATLGTSSAALVYEYSDLNNAKALSQYRLQQTDIDGKTKYSEIRSVRGLDQEAKTIIFPNPTSNGRFTVLFDDAASMKDVLLSDMNGRAVKQWHNVATSLQIDNMMPGLYTIKIIDKKTGSQSIEKIVVNR